MTRFSAALCLLGVVAVSACSVSAESPVGPSRKPQPVPAEATERAAPPEVTGEVPAQVLDKLKADLVEQRGVAAAGVKVISAKSVIWPNGGLGCARPGEIVTQATVPGYRVELEADGRHYVYHAAERGYFRLCENPQGSGLDRGSIR